MSLATVRAALEAALEETEIPVFAYLPNSFGPPAIVILPADSFITSGDTFGNWNARFEVFIYAEDGDNEHISTAMDNTIIDVLNALDNTEASEVEVTRPGRDTYGGTTVLSCRVSLTYAFTS